MNHKLLLIKYLRHVANVEGVTFTDKVDRTDIGAEDIFTDVEWAELQTLAGLALYLDEGLLSTMKAE